MTHCVTGIIGVRDVLAARAADWKVAPVIDLAQGLALLPLTNDTLDTLFAPFPEQTTADFNYLHDAMITALAKASQGGALVYFETEYFGGAGEQGAAAFQDGKLVYGPAAASIGPINEALKVFSIESDGNGHDAFDQLGLGTHRSTERWAERAKS